MFILTKKHVGARGRFGETGLCYIKCRYYDPETIHGLNLYTYCLNNSVMFIDPTGHEVRQWQWLLGIGAIVGAVIGRVAGYIGYTPTKITGFTKHGINQVISRDGHSVANKALLDTVKNYKRIEQQGLFRSKFKFIGKNAVVTLNKSGKVITACAKNKAGWRFVLSLLWIGLGLQIEN